MKADAIRNRCLVACTNAEVKFLGVKDGLCFFSGTREGYGDYEHLSVPATLDIDCRRITDCVEAHFAECRARQWAKDQQWLRSIHVRWE